MIIDRYRILLLTTVCLSFFTVHAQMTSVPMDRNQLENWAGSEIRSNPDSAIQRLTHLQLHYLDIGNPILQELSRVYLGEALMEADKIDEAGHLLGDLSMGPKAATQPYARALAYRQLGKMEFHQGRFYASTLKIRAALELAQNAREEALVADLQEDLALVFDKVSKPDKALQFYKRSFQLNEKLGKHEALQKNSLSLGRVYLSIGQLDSAEYFLNKSLLLSGQLNDQITTTESRIEMAQVQLAKTQYPSVEEAIRSIQPVMKGIQDPFLNIRFHVLRMQYAMAVLGEAAALEHYKKAEALSKQGFTPFIDYFIKSNLADAYYRAGKVDKAYELVKYLNHNSSSYSNKEHRKLAESVAQNSELNIRDREIDFLKLQNQLQQERLRRELALQEGLRRENEFKDRSLQQEQQLVAAADREKLLQTDQLEKEKALNQLLLRENELKKATLHEEKKLRTVLWSSITLLAMLSGLIFYLFRKQKEKNGIIIRQTNDLEFINKEVHHRVKNNLQVISSMLDLQSQFNPDKRFESLLKESKNRVQSMAFIHQNLYEASGMNMVDMPSYIRHLTEHLLAAYKKEGESVEMDVRIQPIQLHMDRVVSVGMIINELVTNSLKYAFAESARGTIRVSLNETDGVIELGIDDDGKGIPQNIDVQSSNTFGYKMVRAFVQKLKAEITIRRDHGTQIMIRFKQK